MPHEFKDDTLDDVRDRDIFNLETFLRKKGRQTKLFDSRDAARKFMGIRLNDIMNKLGIDVARGAIDESYSIDKRMELARVQVENRVYDEEDDKWRSGLYVYKSNEIAGFVGYPIFDPKKFMGYSILCTEKI